MNKSERPRILIALLVLVVAFALPRGLALDRLVTPDEVTWLMASSNFYLALTHGDFAHTYQLEHPGVTTMWAGAAGFASRFPEYKTEATGPMVLGEEDPGPILQSLGHE